MASVTQRIKEIQQPRGGYLPLKLFSKEILDDGIVLHEQENIHASLIGMAVDYLTRFMLGEDVERAFHISTLGASKIGMQNKAEVLKSHIVGLDNTSITAACKLAGFDVCFRSSIAGYKPIEEITPDLATIENIRTMVSRSLHFWNKYGPVLHSEPTFEGGYSPVVNTGDGDFVTKDTLWDFKVSKTAPTTKHTLQILMYYIMGIHSIHDYFKNITHLGFYNPRLNTVYLCPVFSIPRETFKEVEYSVICYHGYPLQQKSQQSSPAKKPVAPSPVGFSVADICNATGQKKSAVYTDIRAGKLYATKKGNKYIITKDEFDRYIEYIEARRKLVIFLSILLGAVAIFMYMILFSTLY